MPPAPPPEDRPIWIHRYRWWLFFALLIGLYLLRTYIRWEMR
jgi:hypothetical protein